MTPEKSLARRDFRSRKPSSCRNRAAKSSTICSPVSPTAEVTKVNRSCYRSGNRDSSLISTWNEVAASRFGLES